MQNINFIILWRENDWGLFKRRNESLLYEFSKKDYIQSLLHIEPLTIKRLLGLFVRWWQAKDKTVRQVYRLHFKKAFFLWPVSADNGGKIFVFSVFVLYPGQMLLLKKISDFCIRLQIGIVNKKYIQSKKNIIVIAYPPSSYLPEIIRTIKHDILLADLVDDVISRTNDRVKKERFINICKTVLPQCRHIFSTSPALKAYQRFSGQEIEYLPNGVDAEEFTLHTSVKFLKNNNRKVVGYVGNLNKLLDLELLEYVIACNPHVDFVLIGRIERETARRINNIIKANKNCYYFGERKHSDIPWYLLKCDVLASFKKADYTTAGNDSMKIYQYLLSGKPVVTLPLTPADRFTEIIYIAKDKYEFSDYLKQALREDDTLLREKRKKAAEENSWEKRANIILSRIAGLITELN